MPSISYQKLLLREDIEALLAARYAGMDTECRRRLFRGICRMAARPLTLRELKNWKKGLIETQPGK